MDIFTGAISFNQRITIIFAAQIYTLFRTWAMLSLLISRLIADHINSFLPIRYKPLYIKELRTSLYLGTPSIDSC